MLLKTVKNLKNSKVTLSHSHFLTLSFYHSLAILLSHSLSLDMLNNFCLFLISLVDFLSLRNVRRNKMMIDDLGWIYCKTLLQNLPEPMIFGTCSWQRDWLLQIYRVHLSEPEGGVTNSQSKYRGCRKPTVFATNTGTSIVLRGTQVSKHWKSAFDLVQLMLAVIFHPGQRNTNM